MSRTFLYKGNAWESSNDKLSKLRTKSDGSGLNDGLLKMHTLGSADEIAYLITDPQPVLATLVKPLNDGTTAYTVEDMDTTKCKKITSDGCTIYVEAQPADDVEPITEYADILFFAYVDVNAMTVPTELIIDLSDPIFAGFWKYNDGGSSDTQFVLKNGNGDIRTFRTYGVKADPKTKKISFNPSSATHIPLLSGTNPNIFCGLAQIGNYLKKKYGYTNAAGQDVLTTEGL